MKKLNLIVILLVAFLCTTITVNATTLDCSTTLKKGSKGESVKVLQTILNEKENCGLDPDGSFGNLTKSCVIKFQKDNNLRQDGIVGSATCNALNGTTSSTVITTYEETSTVRAVVIVDEANVRKSASTSSTKITSVKSGTVVRIVGETDDWYKIKATNNTYGYIRSDLVSKDCIIVDISDQQMYYYSNGQKTWSTKVVTGNQGNHDTPTGNYVMSRSNFRYDTYLRGTNDNGTKYKSHVDYWMPFITSRGIGFHDASWRTSDEFTTSTFKGSGSHGCVNMMHAAAEKLYNEVPDTYNVVVRD